jgi:acetyl esterase/lipase
VLSRVCRLFLMAVLASGIAGAAISEDAKGDCAREDIKKIEGPNIWVPGPNGKQTPLWPDGAKILAPETGGKPEWTGNGSLLIGGRTWNWATYVTTPTMTFYTPQAPNTRAAMLVLPGGGYAAVAMDLEGTEICDWVTKQGMTCVLLKYRVPQIWPRDKNENSSPPGVQLPLQDAQRAMGLLRQQADAYDIDPTKIGVIGFSAGAHLGAALSNAEERTYDSIDEADEKSSRPDFAILLYPGKMWDKSEGKTSLELAPWVEINGKAPPTLLIHAMNDPVNDVRNSMSYGLALKEAGVPVDMRFFAKGCHAFGLRPTADPVTTEWPGHVAEWLRDLDVK